jgi:hypothetical protein
LQESESEEKPAHLQGQLFFKLQFNSWAEHFPLVCSVLQQVTMAPKLVAKDAKIEIFLLHFSICHFSKLSL